MPQNKEKNINRFEYLAHWFFSRQAWVALGVSCSPSLGAQHPAPASAVPTDVSERLPSSALSEQFPSTAAIARFSKSSWPQFSTQAACTEPHRAQMAPAPPHPPTSQAAAETNPGSAASARGEHTWSSQTLTNKMSPRGSICILTQSSQGCKTG